MVGTLRVTEAGGSLAEVLGRVDDERLERAAPARMPCHAPLPDDLFAHPQPTYRKADVDASPAADCGKLYCPGAPWDAAGSGCAIAPRIVLTAMHVVTDPVTKAPRPDIVFLPRYWGNLFPWMYPVQKVCYFQEYLDDPGVTWDIALCITFEDMTRIGHREVNLQYDFQADAPIKMLGYPAGLAGGNALYEDTGYANFEAATHRNAWSALARLSNGGAHGVSGGPWLDAHNRVIGINAVSDFSATVTSPNFADGRFAALLAFAQSQVDAAFPETASAFSREPCLR